MRFDHPWMLLLGLLVVPLLIHGVRSLNSMDRARRTTALTLRTCVMLALAVALAGPQRVREHDGLSVIGLLDISRSVRHFADLPEIEGVRRSPIEFARRWFRDAFDEKRPDDRMGLIIFDGESIAVSVPTSAGYVDDIPSIKLVDGTNIAEAIQLGLAMFPPDTSRRLVLFSDGRETAGDAVASARLAAGVAEADGLQQTIRSGVPIDIAPVIYNVASDARIVRVETPPNAQPGQTVVVRIIMESTRPIEGRLALLHENIAVDLNASDPGRDRTVSLPTGESVHLARVRLGQTPVNRFEAIFDPLAPSDDAVPDNNRAESFTATPSRGAILVLSEVAGKKTHPLARMLTDGDVPVTVRHPVQFPRDLLALQAFDLIILDNLPAYALDEPQHELLARYVNDLGGGLIMTGGEKSFGAGGWNGTAVEAVLPLELDPPAELVRPSAALVLVIDKSGSMNDAVAGARASQQEIANSAAALAIQSLRSDSLVGVVAFDSAARVIVPLRRNDDAEAIAEQVDSIQADGGTNLAPALKAAYRMLQDVDADRKRIVCLSDGRSSEQNLDSIVTAMTDENIKLSTIAIGDKADRDLLSALAELGEGEYYFVRNPRTLPRVVVDSVQVLNKPLIKEVPFVPVVLPTGSTLTAGMDVAPILEGIVITAPRDDSQVVLEMLHPDGEPLLAHWQIGLGRTAAFTSDIDGAWSQRWIDWPTAAVFWRQLARLTSRPSLNRDAELVTFIRNDRLHISYETRGDTESFLDYLDVNGTVYAPDGARIPARLQQTAPGRYETSLPVDQAGNYIVALNPRRGTVQLAPAIGGASRTASPEFSHYRSNLALLDEIAQITGGRRLDVTSPLSAGLFNRSGMPSSRSLLPAWRAVFWLILPLLLLDIAARRIAWSGAMIIAGVRRATAWVRPGHARGQQASATLATLRQASERFDERLDAEAGGITKLQGKNEIRLPTRRNAPEPPQTDPKGVRSVLGTILGRGPEVQESDPATNATPQEAEPSPSPDRTDKPDQQADEPDASTTSSLLAAKRRARKRLRDG